MVGQSQNLRGAAAPSPGVDQPLDAFLSFTGRPTIILLVMNDKTLNWKKL